MSVKSSSEIAAKGPLARLLFALPPSSHFVRPFTRVRVRFLPAIDPGGLTVEEIRDRTREAVLTDSLSGSD